MNLVSPCLPEYAIISPSQLIKNLVVSSIRFKDVFPCPSLEVLLCYILE